MQVPCKTNFHIRYVKAYAVEIIIIIIIIIIQLLNIERKKLDHSYC